MDIIRSVATATQLGRTVKDRRRQQGLTQGVLARRAQVGRRFLIELEAGKATTETGKVLDVLDALGLDLFIVPRAEQP